MRASLRATESQKRARSHRGSLQAPTNGLALPGLPLPSVAPERCLWRRSDMLLAPLTPAGSPRTSPVHCFDFTKYPTWKSRLHTSKSFYSRFPTPNPNHPDSQQFGVICVLVPSLITGMGGLKSFFFFLTHLSRAIQWSKRNLTLALNINDITKGTKYSKERRGFKGKLSSLKSKVWI